MSFLGTLDTAAGLMNWGNVVSGGAAASAGISSVLGGYANANAYNAYGDYAKDIAQHNADVALQSAEADVHRIGYETSQRLALLHTELTGSGLRMTGTPLSLMASEHAKATYQKQQARYAGKVNAQQALFQGETAAFEYGIRASDAKMAGWGGLAAGFGSATGSLLQVHSVNSLGQPDPTSNLGDAYGQGAMIA